MKNYLVVGLVALLFGCSSQPTKLTPGPLADEISRNTNATDPTNIDKRWGVLGRLAGHTYFTQKSAFTDDWLGVQWEWVVPGLRLQESWFTPKYADRRDIQYFPDEDKIAAYKWGSSAYERSHVVTIMPDGSTLEPKLLLGIVDELKLYQPQPQQLVRQSGSATDLMSEVSNKSFSEFYANHRRAMAKSEAESERAFANFLNTMAEGAYQVSAAVQQEVNQRQSTAPQMPRPVAPSPAARPPAPSPAGAAKVAAAKQSAPAAQPQPKSVASVNTEKKPQRKQYPEAIMVCTKPTGPKGNFKCLNPLNSESGHLEDISGSRTPEEMVRSTAASCPAPHRLQSSSHLVWGCGFAATNFFNALDRSAGVDVQGRRSYYCEEEESSCRRTTP